MKKTTCVLVGALVLFLSGYALGRRHHVPRISIDYESADLLIVEPVPPPPPPTTGNRQPAVLPASHSDQTQSQGYHSHQYPNHGSSKLLGRYAGLRTIKSQNPGQGMTTQVDTWKTCAQNYPVKITFSLDDNADNDHIDIVVAPKTN